MKICNKIEIGDIIAVAGYGNFSLGIFAGNSPKGKPRYYYIGSPADSNRVAALLKEGRKPYRYYIVRKYDNTIVKVRREDLNTDMATASNILLNALYEYNIIPKKKFN